MALVGDKRYIAFEFDSEDRGPLRRIDLWLNNQIVNCDDNNTYMPSYLHALEGELDQERNFYSYASLFKGMTPEQVHLFILSTRTEDSENYDFDDDRIFTCLRFLRLDETTDNFISFIFFIEETIYITYEFWRETHHDKEQIGKVNWFSCEKKDVFKVLKQAITCLS